MALSYQRDSALPPGLVADRTLCLDKTATRLVPEGSAESAYQLINAGREVPADEVERLGLYLDAEGKIAQRGQEAPPAVVVEEPPVADPPSVVEPPPAVEEEMPEG